MRSAPKPCSNCGALVSDGTARCDKHKVRPGTFADRSRGTRQQRGYGAHWDKLRLVVLRRDAGMCKCDDCKAAGRIREATEVDHIVNKARWRQIHGSLSGVDAESNLQAINSECHAAKTAREARGGSESLEPRNTGPTC